MITGLARVENGAAIIRTFEGYGNDPLYDGTSLPDGWYPVVAKSVGYHQFDIKYGPRIKHPEAEVERLKKLIQLLEGKVPLR